MSVTSVSNVVVRFMSLLDVALILVGVLMLMLIQSSPRSLAGREDAVSWAAGGAAESAETSRQVIADQIRLVYVYAGWRGDRDGRCFELTPTMKIGREISVGSDRDIRRLIARTDSRGNSRGGGRREGRGDDSTTAVVVLLFERDGWFPSWTAEKIQSLRQVWGVDVVPLYNARLPGVQDKPDIASEQG